MPFYTDASKNNFYQLFKEKYSLENLVKTANSDIEVLVLACNWVHHLWQHDGWNEPQNYDAISIIEEAKTGKNFRCVEYTIVLSMALNALGFPARSISLKTADVETKNLAARHVAVECFIGYLNKWVFIDPQFNVLFESNGQFLNAVELQHHLTKDASLINVSENLIIEKQAYFKWIYPYLFYFDVMFDLRRVPIEQKQKYKGKFKLMLVPLGAKNPTIFQKNSAN